MVGRTAEDGKQRTSHRLATYVGAERDLWRRNVPKRLASTRVSTADQVASWRDGVGVKKSSVVGFQHRAFQCQDECQDEYLTLTRLGRSLLLFVFSVFTNCTSLTEQRARRNINMAIIFQSPSNDDIITIIKCWIS